MSLEEKILKYKRFQEQIKALEEEKQKIYAEILEQFSQDQKEVFSENYRVRKYSRVSIKTSVEEAKCLDAVKTEELVDKEKIKALIASGIFVPNVTEASYFLIYPLKKEN